MHWTALIQLLVAAGLGAAIGTERELTAQPAGLRTHMLVGLGAALFTLAGTHLLGSDPARIAAQVVTGIGFLGGGAILREGANVRGLTTAASLWVTAAVGLAVGLRAYYAAVAATIVALLVLTAIRLVERYVLPNRRMLEVTLTLEAGAPIETIEREALRSLPDSRVSRLTYSEKGQAMVLVAKPQEEHSLITIGEHLLATPGVLGVDLSR